MKESSGPESLDGSHSMCGKSNTGEKSRADNAWNSLSASCIHRNRVSLEVEAKDDDFSPKSCKGKVTRHHFLDGGDVLSSSISGTSNCKQITSSETSNLPSLCSSHDSFSGNAESKTGLGVSDPSEDIEIFASTGQSISEKSERKKESDNLGDSGSLTGGSSITCKMVGNRTGKTCRKKASCGLTTSSAVRPIQEAIDDKSNSCSQMSNSRYKGSTKASMLPKTVKQLPEEIEARPHKSELSVNSSFKIHDGTCSHKKALSACSEDQTGSSLTGIGKSRDGHMLSEDHSAKSVKVDPMVTSTNLASKVSNCEDERESVEKSGMLLEKTNTQANPFESQSVNPIDESDDVSVEVRVCDICGDVGREALLAFCSNCEDGAEHIYCMRVMLGKVPRDWMCEECMLEMEKERHNHDRYKKEEVLKRTSSLNGKRHNPGSSGALNSQSRTKLSTGGSNVLTNLRKSGSAHLFYKKSASESERVSKTKRTLDSPVGSFGTVMPPNKSQSSRYSSMLDLEKWKIKPAHGITTVGSCSSSGNVAFTSSPLTPGYKDLRLQEKGSFVKSKSFSGTDSKVKSQLQKEDNAKIPHTETAKGDGKKNVAEGFTKSESFNRASTNNPSDSPVETGKRLRQEKECHLSQKRQKLESHNLSPRLPITGSSASTPKSKKGSLSMNVPVTGSSTSRLKTGKQNHLMRSPFGSPSLKAHKSSDAPKAKTDKGEFFKWSPKSGSLAPASESGKGSISMNSSKITADFPTSIPMDVSGISLLKTNKSIHPPSLPAAASGATTPMVHERAASGNIKVSELPSGAKFNDMKTVEGDKKAKIPFKGDSHVQSRVGKDPQQGVHLTRLASADIESAPCPTYIPNERRYSKDTCNSASPATVNSTNSALPHHERIWLGEFETSKPGRLPSPCTGIQAHLSVGASPKVLEAVNMIPKKMLLQEVPRRSIWPTQFHENHATEDKIALFFFAEDIDSFKRYKNLVQCMMDNDLALQGTVGEYDLLIFSSNLLPERSQRWNSLLFLWGVFKGRRVHHSKPVMRPVMATGKPSLGIASSGQNSVGSHISDMSEHCTDQRECTMGSEQKSDAKEDSNGNSARDYEERECKRMKDFSQGIDEQKCSSHVEDATNKFSVGVDGIGCSTNAHGYEGTYNAEAYEDERVKVPAISSPEGSMLKIKSSQQLLHPLDPKDQLGCGATNIELPVVKEQTFEEVMLSSHGTMEQKNNRENPVNAVCDDKNEDDNQLSTSLSLSLALPSSEENRFSESNPNKKEPTLERRGVYLFGTLLK